MNSEPPIHRDRRLWRLGTSQLIVTMIAILVINLIARRLGLGFAGSIILIGAIAFSWPFVATWWARRRERRRRQGG